ncbi:hypothetical protein D3C72_1690450 [compost metagenome]
MMASAPTMTATCICCTLAPNTWNGAADSGDGNIRSSLPQMFSATFLKMMASAMVDMIQPNSDLILMAGRTPIHSTNTPCKAPKTMTMGIINR